MRKLIIIGFLVMSASLWGQDYNFEASIQNVNKSDFVRISLSPEITSHLKTDFSDIRIYDTNEVEVPYLFYQENHTNERSLFMEYDILEKVHNRKLGYTRVVIHNATKAQINNIVLRIKNADVRKQLKLNASNDQKNWYVLKDNYYYNSIENSDHTTEIRVLNFPLSDYEYYELLIGDYFDKPINILQAGFYNHIKEIGKYTEIKTPKFTVKDTLKETILCLPINGNYLDKISFDIDLPRYYHREVEVFMMETVKYKKRVSVQEKSLQYFHLISNSSNVFALANIQADTIYIRIKNHDNPVLSFQAIHLYQLNKYLVAELDANEKYKLLFSDQNSLRPNYDLKYFSDSIQSNLSAVKCGQPKLIQKADKESVNTNFNLNDYWLWIIIIGVALLLAYMSFGMLKDKKATKE